MIDVLGYEGPTSYADLWDLLDAARGRAGGDPRCGAPSFVRADSLGPGVGAIDKRPPAVVCAGCTDLIPKARAGLLEPAIWIDLRRIAPLQGFTYDADQVVLGACLTHHQVATSPWIRQELPALAAACASVGSRQIRTRGTLGGNAANASPCADSLLALHALDAEVVLRSRSGSRQVPVTSFCSGPGGTVLDRGEVIESFVVPRRSGRRTSFLKLGPRKAVAVAKVSAAAAADIEDGRLRDVRLVMGSVAPTQIHISEAEALLEGMAPDEALLRQVGEVVARAVKPIDDVRSTARYRRIASGVLARRAIAARLSCAGPPAIAGSDRRCPHSSRPVEVHSEPDAILQRSREVGDVEILYLVAAIVPVLIIILVFWRLRSASADLEPTIDAVEHALKQKGFTVVERRRGSFLTSSLRMTRLGAEETTFCLGHVAIARDEPDLALLGKPDHRLYQCWWLHVSVRATEPKGFPVFAMRRLHEGTSVAWGYLKPHTWMVKRHTTGDPSFDGLFEILVEDGLEHREVLDAETRARILGLSGDPYFNNLIFLSSVHRPGYLLAINPPLPSDTVDSTDLVVAVARRLLQVYGS